MAASSSRRSFSSTASLTKELSDFARPDATSFFARRRTSPGMLRATFAEFILFYYRGYAPASIGRADLVLSTRVARWSCKSERARTVDDGHSFGVPPSRIEARALAIERRCGASCFADAPDDH